MGLGGGTGVVVLKARRDAAAAPAPAATSADSAAAKDTSAKPAAAATKPEIVEMIDFDTLALAQLRARLRTLSIEDLETLLEYENATSARAPFQTMLANRITTAKAK